MRIAKEAAAHAHTWTRVVKSSLVRLVARVIAELRMTIDIARWREARTPAERLAALSWPRVGAFGAIPLGLIAGLFAVHSLTRPDAYPPPFPSSREIAVDKTLRTVSHTPPPGLVEANKSWKAE